MHSGWIVPDGVLSTKEDARWVLDHVVALARVAGDDRGGEDVIVVAACTRRDKAVAASVEKQGIKKDRKVREKNLLQGSARHRVTTVSLGVGTLAAPKMPLRTAMQRPTMTSSETFSMIAAASPATRASRTGALKRKYELCVDLSGSPCRGSRRGKAPPCWRWCFPHGRRGCC